ncbi:lipid-A-disaccharide synthase N-terminal domain-containing protein [Pedosphaera parvula]|uniref:Lipid A biosynthesis domain protein n=1 Tax=Pedosphaera parvula (strain Ellin514) TaxID=320771 RepID=B9XPQ0_PEDPL|nr:lipid-A-disaccharide synthase N-terminal domain-containing protein [Pedosphaera parvula]EEF58173.1 lipid A biosynthesis domain protein [Pedosphaera parvula Ellin514]
MDSLEHLLWHNGHFLGIDWSVWKCIGWMGNAIFSTRFVVQWYATEKRKQVVVPAAFWWLSLTGSLLLLSYALFYQHDSVFIFAYAFTWIPYIRNLIIQRRHAEAHLQCSECEAVCAPKSNFCSTCGADLKSAPSQMQH